LAETRVEPQERVDREQPLAERNLRVSENCARLIIERAVAILTEIALKRPITAVLTGLQRNYSCRTRASGVLALFDFRAAAELYQQSPTEERYRIMAVGPSE